MDSSNFLDKFRPHILSAMASISANLASEYHERIETGIKDFYKNLDKDEQLLVTVPLRNGRNVFAEWFGYYNPHMIIVDGIQAEDGRKVRLLIHQTNLQIVLQKLKPEGEKRTIKKIGFQAREKKTGASKDVTVQKSSEA